jgi:hypothetical protein
MAAIDIDEGAFAEIHAILANTHEIDFIDYPFSAIIEETAACGDVIEASVIWVIVSPTEFSALEKRDPIVVDVEFNNVKLLDLHISVQIKSLGIDDVVFQNGRFTDKYQAFSQQRFTGSGKRFSIRRTEGWPVQDADSEQDDITLVVFGCRSSTELPT